jgi:Asp-tRNA(Asn)/Glu-tRNA(Gln) amidotransferase A subunit family amidase
MSGTRKKRVVVVPITTSSDGGGIGMQLVAAAGRDLELREAAATLLAS